MKLKNLHIERNTYDFNFHGIAPGEAGGSIEFANGDKSTISIRLTPDHCQRLLEVVADALVDTAKELALTLRRDIIEHAKPSFPAT